MKERNASTGKTTRAPAITPTRSAADIDLMATLINYYCRSGFLMKRMTDWTSQPHQILMYHTNEIVLFIVSVKLRHHYHRELLPLVAVHTHRTLTLGIMASIASIHLLIRPTYNVIV